jgi:hypothetical protein
VTDQRIPNGLPPSVQQILRAAIADLDALIREDRGRPNRGAKVDKFQPPWVAKDPTAEGIPWCASAVCTWWREALGTDPLGKIVRAADGIKDRALQVGQWHSVPSFPAPGDAFVYLQDTDTPGFNKGHTGLVLRVSADGRTIQSIEGNARNGVRLIQRSVPTIPGAKSILGFASPFPTGVRAGYLTTFERGLLTHGWESPGGSTR